MKTALLYAIGLFLTFICVSFYLNTAHGEQIPYISHTDTPQRKKPSLSCGEYLNICESSCSRRGDMYRFLCLGPNFTQGLEQYRCQCGDDAFRQVVKKEQRQESKQETTKTIEQDQEPAE